MERGKINMEKGIKNLTGWFLTDNYLLTICSKTLLFSLQRFREKQIEWFSLPVRVGESEECTPYKQRSRHVLAQRPFTLVLTMINSYSCSLLIVLWYLVSNIYQDISRRLASTKVFLELSHDDSRAQASRSHLALGWSQARWIAFGSSRLGEGVLQEDLSLFSLRLCLDHCKD